MEILGIIPKTEKEEAQYIVQATEKELDKISGIADVEHIAGRIKVGHEIKISEVYDKLDYFTKHKKKLKQVPASLREAAKIVQNLLPKET